MSSTFITIGIGGAHSGAGKTAVAEALLSSLQGFGAIKVSPSRVFASIIDDHDVIAEKSKDTARMLEAGAAEVLLVRSPRESLEEALGLALGRLSGVEGAIVEGNSAIEVLKPDIVIFIFGSNVARIKESGRRVLALADIVVYTGQRPEGIPEGAVAFETEGAEALISYVRELVDRLRGGKEGA